MRACLMMLGVVLHSAQVFNPSKTWAVYSDSSVSFTPILIQIIHTFRMPSFFIISGYFCLFTIEKYGENQFLNIRLKRIFIPLIATALTLNSIQYVILSRFGWKQFDFQNYIYTGGWVSHLWFLINLFIYFVLSYFFVRIFRKYNYISSLSLTQGLRSYCQKKSVVIILFMLPFFTLLLLGAGKLGFPLYANILGFIDIYSLAMYFPYFLFGIYLKYDNKLLNKFSTLSPLLSVSVIVASILLFQYSVVFDGTLKLIVQRYLENLSVWFSTSLCFYVFLKYTNVYTEYFRNLSDSSYTIYLFHHVFVISFGILIINLKINSLVGFFLILISTLFMTICIHKYFIAKNRFLKFIFNGK